VPVWSLDGIADDIVAAQVTDKNTRREMAYKQRFARAQADRNDKVAATLTVA